MQIEIGTKFTRSESWNFGHVFVVERINPPYYDVRDLQSVAKVPVMIYTREEIERHLTPLALDGAIAPDNQQVLPADVLVGEGTLPETPRQ